MSWGRDRAEPPSTALQLPLLAFSRHRLCFLILYP